MSNWTVASDYSYVLPGGATVRVVVDWTHDLGCTWDDIAPCVAMTQVDRDTYLEADVSMDLDIAALRDLHRALRAAPMDVDFVDFTDGTRLYVRDAEYHTDGVIVDLYRDYGIPVSLYRSADCYLLTGEYADRVVDIAREYLDGTLDIRVWRVRTFVCGVEYADDTIGCCVQWDVSDVREWARDALPDVGEFVRPGDDTGAPVLYAVLPADVAIDV